MLIQAPPRTRLAFPCRKARFSSSHLASKGTYASIVPVASGMADLLHPSIPTANNTNGSAIKVGLLGPVLNNTTNFHAITFGGYPTTAYSNYTKAVIIQFTSVASLQPIFGDGATSGGSGFAGGANLVLTAGALVQISATGISAFNTTITLVANVPYFIAFSYTSTAAAKLNAIAIRLDNGTIQTSTVTVSTSAVTAPTGTMSIGNTSAVDAFYIAAAMASNNFMSPQQLLMWANDPWSFWYPQP